MFGVAAMKPERPDWDGVDASRGATVNIGRGMLRLELAGRGPKRRSVDVKFGGCRG